MEARDYREGDLRLLCELAQELGREDRAALSCDFGQIAFWSAQLLHGDWAARLWFDDGRLAGWGWLTQGSELEWQVRPGHEPLLDDILDWAQPSEALVCSHHHDAIARLHAHGLAPAPDEPWMRVNHRSLDALEAPDLPEGFVLRTMAEYDDYPSRAAAHRSAFAPSRFRDDVYAAVRETWPYRADLDCVAVAPDGSVAAFTLAWLDDVNRLGELEPVGTHEDYRRRGLGRAVNLFALQRLREEGATEAIVACRGDAGSPLPALLYESVGFREVVRTVPFRRSVERS